MFINIYKYLQYLQIFTKCTNIYKYLHYLQISIKYKDVYKYLQISTNIYKY